MSKWDTPPGGDFARYIEELSRQSPQQSAPSEMTAPGAVGPAPPAPATTPAPPPGSVGAKNAAAVATAQRAAAARKGRSGAADPPFISNATAAPVSAVPQPADLWKALRLPVFAYIALEIAAAFLPVLQPFTTPALFAFIAWAVVRIVKMVGGSEGWQKAGRQIAEEMRKQQRDKRS
ncbi:MAG TPA: hypothetical protein VLJ57_01265 [Burkholderiaceae bacterium]|nr:hypothetical protein [Burkholderiaceae bacterium]